MSHCRSIESGPRDSSGVRTAPGSRVILPVSWIQADNLLPATRRRRRRVLRRLHVDEPEWDVTASHHAGFHSEAPIEAVWFVTEILVGYAQGAVERLRTKHRGASEAALFVREVQRALHAFPLDEKPRPVRHIRCRTCQHESLRWQPPRAP